MWSGHDGDPIVPRLGDVETVVDSPLWADVFENDLYRDLIATRAVQRLNHIRFLGAIDHLFRPNGRRLHRRHTRFDHSIGVALLGLEYARLMGLSPPAEKRVVAAALLHDVGHPPLSHSMEPVFERFLGLNHHIAGREIILGRSPLGTEVRDVLRGHGVDPRQVVALLEPGTTAAGMADEEVRPFAGPINIDTVEAISRSWSYVSRLGMPDSPRAILHAFVRRQSADTEILDRFWQSKGRVYKYIINDTRGYVADQVAQRALSRFGDRLKTADFFLDERRFVRRFGYAFGDVARYGGAFVPEGEEGVRQRSERVFFVEAGHPLGAWSLDHKRYRCRKEPVTDEPRVVPCTMP